MARGGQRLEPLLRRNAQQRTAPPPQKGATPVPTRNLDWKAEAACRDLPTSIFFPDSESDSGPALAVCATCPVREQCLDFALRTRQHDGVWGGATETERKRIRRRMGRVAAA